MTDHQLLMEFIDKNSDYIIHSKVDDSGDKVKFTLVLTTPTLQEARRKYGARVVGLDSVYKWTKHHIPIWLLVVDTDTHGGLVVAVIISTSGSGRSLKEALHSIFGDDEEEAPTFMIDHDEAEAWALRALGV